MITEAPVISLSRWHRPRAWRAAGARHQGLLLCTGCGPQVGRGTAQSMAGCATALPTCPTMPRKSVYIPLEVRAGGAPLDVGTTGEATARHERLDVGGRRASEHRLLAQGQQRYDTQACAVCDADLPPPMPHLHAWVP